MKTRSKNIAIVLLSVLLALSVLFNFLIAYYAIQRDNKLYSATSLPDRTASSRSIENPVSSMNGYSVYASDPLVVPATALLLEGGGYTDLTYHSSNVGTLQSYFNFYLPLTLYYRYVVTGSGSNLVVDGSFYFVTNFTAYSFNEFCSNRSVNNPVSFPSPFGFGELCKVAISGNTFNFTPLDYTTDFYHGSSGLHAFLQSVPISAGRSYKYAVFFQADLKLFSYANLKSISFSNTSSFPYSLLDGIANGSSQPYKPYHSSRFVFDTADSSRSTLTFLYSSLTSFYPDYIFYTSNSLNGSYREGYDSGFDSGLSTGYVNGYSAGETAGYSNGYSDGKNFGYNSGLEEGKQLGSATGYQQGYAAGSSDGYDIGFASGTASANDYTFLGLIGAVIDAPIQALTGLLNFDILGFKMSAFVLSLFTVCVVLKLVSVLLGGFGR